MSLLRQPWKRHRRARGVTPEQVQAAVWRKSSASGYNGNCTEIAFLDDGRVAMRDSKDHGAGPVLAFTEQAWREFLEGTASGEWEPVPHSPRRVLAALLRARLWLFKRLAR